MGKTRDLFKKIRDTKGTFHAKMGTIKNRKVRNFGKERQKQQIKKRWQEYNTQNCTKKILMTQITTMVFSHLELDILECEVKWALGSITVNKANGGDGIPTELFQILKDDAGKVLHSILSKCIAYYY